MVLYVLVNGMFGQVLESHFNMLKWSQVNGIFTPSVTNHKSGRIIAKAWDNMAIVMTWPMKYYTHVGVNQSMVILHIFGNVQHTLTNQCLQLMWIFGNFWEVPKVDPTTCARNDQPKTYPKPTQKLNCPGAHVMVTCWNMGGQHQAMTRPIIFG